MADPATHPPLPDPEYWACDYPERPAEPGVCYAMTVDCDHCYMAAVTEAKLNPGATTMAWLVQAWTDKRALDD